MRLQTDPIYGLRIASGNDARRIHARTAKLRYVEVHGLQSNYTATTIFTDGSKHYSSNNAEQLLKKHTGYYIPVKSLFYWISTWILILRRSR